MHGNELGFMQIRSVHIHYPSDHHESVAPHSHNDLEKVQYTLAYHRPHQIADVFI